MMSQDSSLLETWRSFAARRRIKLNRIILIVVLLFLTHPRIRVFFWFGFAIALAGALLRVWAKVAPSWRTLNPGSPSGADFSLTTLLSGGPYRMVRHPAYLGTMIEALGIWVACFSFSKMFSWIAFGIFLLFYFFFIYKESIILEEDALSLRWPAQWENYSSVTPALIPTRDSLARLGWPDWRRLDWGELESTREWKNFLACIGVFALLWLKLIYRI